MRVADVSSISGNSVFMVELPVKYCLAIGFRDSEKEAFRSSSPRQNCKGSERAGLKCLRENSEVKLQTQRGSLRCPIQARGPRQLCCRGGSPGSPAALLLGWKPVFGLS